VGSRHAHVDLYSTPFSVSSVHSRTTSVHSDAVSYLLSSLYEINAALRWSPDLSVTAVHNATRDSYICSSLCTAPIVRDAEYLTTVDPFLIGRSDVMLTGYGLKPISKPGTSENARIFLFVGNSTATIVKFPFSMAGHQSALLDGWCDKSCYRHLFADLKRPSVASRGSLLISINFCTDSSDRLLGVSRSRPFVYSFALGQHVCVGNGLQCSALLVNVRSL
jgi:hypothetical protein